MEKRTLIGTDLEVSRVCFGTMTFGSQVGESDAFEMMQTCIDRGVNFFDTANSYNGGRSEEMVGRALHGRRDQVVLATKVFNKMSDDPDGSGLSRAAIVRAVEDSLRRLQTDYLDIYFMHAPDYKVPLEETLLALENLTRDGKVRYVGASNFASWQLCRMHWIADEYEWSPVLISQPMYNLLARGIEQEFLPACATLGVSTVVYNPLAGGLLTGKHQRQSPISGSRFDGNKMYSDRYWHDANFRAVSQLQDVAESEGRSLISLALNWLFHHSASDCVILGASTIEQLMENFAVLEHGSLSDETLDACDDVWKLLRGVTPQYNR